MSRAPEPSPEIGGCTCIRPLGGGGFADVFLFEQDLPRRRLAIKVLRVAGMSASGLRSFRAEADILASTEGVSGVVQLYQVGVSTAGRPFLAMEYCPGMLSELRGDLQRVCASMVQVGRAVGALHRLGVVHRDVKPGNILLSAQGEPRLCDFGLAVSFDALDESPVGVSGTWSAPEVRLGRSPGSKEADVWSMGTTLAALCTGSVGCRHTSDLPVPLREVIAGATRRHPHRRFPDGDAFAEELERALSAGGVDSAAWRGTAA